MKNRLPCPEQSLFDAFLGTAKAGAGSAARFCGVTKASAECAARFRGSRKSARSVRLVSGSSPEAFIKPQTNGIVCGFDSSGNIMVIHCASSENNVVVTGKSGFTSIARPTYYQELLKSKPSSSTGGPYGEYYE